MTLPKTKLGILLIIISAVIIVFTFSANENSCGIRHVTLINDLQKYEKSLDPEVCEKLIDDINLFNEQCLPEIEIFDCG